MDKKASIELSMGMLVRLIIAIIVFGFGMAMMATIFRDVSLDKVSGDVSSEIEAQIGILLDNGEKVTIYPDVLTVKKNKIASFGIGILNILEENPESYDMVIQCSDYLDRDGNSQGCEEGLPSDVNPKKNPFTFDTFDTLEIKTNEEGYYSVPMLMKDAQQGTYIFNAIISAKSLTQPYGIVKFVVNIK